MSDTPRVDELLAKQTAEHRVKGRVDIWDAGKQVRELIECARELERELNLVRAGLDVMECSRGKPRE